MKKIVLSLTVLFTLLFITACNQKGFKYVEGKVNVVATTTMLGDLAREIGGDNVNVYTIMGVGVDPHSYKPKSSDRRALKGADLVIHNGLHLEAQMGEVIESFAKDTFVAASTLSASDILQDGDLNSDPHIWFNVLLWKKVTLGLGAKLKTMDTANSAAYEAATNSYAQKLDTLDTYVKAQVATLTEAQRILVTAHDAFQYFAHAYGFEVHAIQGISTETEASATDISNLAKLVKDLDVKAIFIESSIPEATIKSVIEAAKALGHNLKVGGELYSDSLGENEDAKYLNAIKHNVDTIVSGLK